MRKVVFLAMIVGGFAGLLRPQVASAQTKPIYAVKFVCGTETFTSTPPDEPPVKPGNYTTAINVEVLTPALTGSTYSWNVSIKDHGVSGSQFVTATRLHDELFWCSSIVARANASNLFGGSAPPLFITGYVNIFPNTGAALAVTGVYTSQGCVIKPGVAPICHGPVSIEVVPETALSFTPPPT